MAAHGMLGGCDVLCWNNRTTQFVHQWFMVEKRRPEMRGNHARSDEFGVEIAAIASAVPDQRIDQEATRNMVLAMAPEFVSHAGLFLNTGIKTRYSCVPLEWHLRQHGWAARN